jgi:hypothetical protein
MVLHREFVRKINRNGHLLFPGTGLKPFPFRLNRNGGSRFLF